MMTATESPIASSGYRHYLAADWPSSLDSLEGVPDWFEPRVKPEHHQPWQLVGYNALSWAGDMLPGVGLALLLALLGKVLADWVGLGLLHFDREKGSPVSPIMLAIVLGLAIRNTVGVPRTFEPGLRFCLKNILRLGIILLGFKLTVFAIVAIGKVGIPIIVVCVTTALLAVTFVNRLLGLPKRLGTLIAVGTSICGVSAIAATAPIIEAEEDETSYSIACITLFGLLALFTYPFLAHWLFAGDAMMTGLFLGTSIHDTAQVAGAGLMYKQQHSTQAVLDTAMAVKLMRNLSMSLLIPLMAILYRRSTGTTARYKQKWHQVVPLFVVGFAAMACLRSLGDAGVKDGGDALGLFAAGAWKALQHQVDATAVWCLMAAMAAVGLGTGLSKLRGLGWKPFSVGFAAAVLVGGVSTLLIKWVVPLVMTR